MIEWASKTVFEVLNIRFVNHLLVYSLLTDNNKCAAPSVSAVSVDSSPL